MATICMEGLPGKIGRCVTFPQWPIGGGKPIPPPKGRNAEAYGNLFVDVSIVDAVHEAAKSISDDEARTALQSGIHAAVSAIQKRAGGEKAVVITLSD
jgi:hypothetical protein